jgi:CubicO group peptidase (beta-lactamase class C family)
MKRKNQKGIIGLLLLAALFFSFSPLFADDASDQVDKLLAPWNVPGSPGCALAIIKDGKIIYKNGYGEANIELGVPITPNTVFYIGSISKQFVAFSVALLESRGKLNFDDDIRQYIPEFPDYGHLITIGHLIHHTSGIRGYLTLMDLAGMDIGYFHQAEEVIKELLKRQKVLNFKPGEKFQYSNSGYLLLAEIVRRVSGMSFREFARKHILKPLGMENSHFHDNYSELIKNRASSYFPDKKNKYKNFISTFDLVGSGGLYTTVEDLFLWDRNFYHYQVGGKAVIETVLTRGKLNNHEEIDYAFGLGHGEYKGLKTVEHGGALGGYRGMLLRFPGQQFSVICLSNFAAFNPSSTCYRVADIYLKDQLKPLPEKEKTKKIRFKKLSLKHLENKNGAYRNPQNKHIVKISADLQNNQLKAQMNGTKLIMAPISKTEFKVVEPARDIIAKFTRKDKKSPFTIQIFIEGRLQDTYEPVALASPSPEDLQEYMGEFFSEELNVTYKFVIRKGKLFVKFRTAPDLPLKPTIRDEFELNRIWYQFSRDKEGKIKGFTLVVEDIMRIPFE